MAEEEKRGEQVRKMNQLVAKCWADEDFKKRFIDDPAAVMREMGIEVVEGKKVKVVEDTADTIHVSLPAKPVELSDESLDI